MRSQRLLKIRREVIEILQNLADEVDGTVYLFGSYARGDHLLDSDVDIVVVSEIFNGMPYIDRVEYIRKLLPTNRDFEIIPLTPQELGKKMHKSFYKAISSYWIEVKRKIK